MGPLGYHQETRTGGGLHLSPQAQMLSEFCSADGQVSLSAIRRSEDP